MADEPASAAPYDPSQKYRVRVARPITIGPFEYLPRTGFDTDGAFLNRIVEERGADAIGSAEPI